MDFNKQLALFSYLLQQFGYQDFDTLRETLGNQDTGYDATGRSYFINVLVGNKNKYIDDQTLLRYDEAIRGYEDKLRKSMAQPSFSLKYFQYLALLFTEYYLDCIHSDKQGFLNALNGFKNSRKAFQKIEDYTAEDLKKLAYWMATGSGKTLVMHCNFWQIRKYKSEWENIILITPNEGLSHQHYEALKASGINARIYAGSEESLNTEHDEVLIIEITKLVQDKEGEGVSVDVDYFAESDNLVFIDEGHKGQKSEERTWKRMRDYITRGQGSFTFEYSATFGQIISNSTPELVQEYGKSIIFDYSYKHFYADGYGKDFSVFNIDVKDQYSEEQTRLLFTASLMGFYEQLTLYQSYREELRPYNIEKPLWVFVGSKVIGQNGSLNKTEKASISDVTQVIRFIDQSLSDPAQLQADMEKILDERSRLLNSEGVDIFKERFQHLKAYRPEAETVLNTVFNGTGQLEAYRIKQQEGEIGLRPSTAKEYFAVINIGDVGKYIKKLEEDTEGRIEIKEDHFTSSLFRGIDSPASPITILIGSKKFIEGWNSWRVSSMGLMNMGKNEGAQIIQLFGRGVRLKGKHDSLKREPSNAPYQIRTLQTILIFGLNASYMNNFLNNIDKETPDYNEYTLEIRFNNPEDWEGKIVTFKTEEGHNFKDYTVALELKENILKRVNIDLRTKVSVAESGFNNEVAEDAGDYHKSLLPQYFDFINFNEVLLEANRFKMAKGYTNLIIQKAALEAVIQNNAYTVMSHPDQFGIKEAVDGTIQEVATMVIKDYINKFYSDKEKDFLTRNITYDTLSVENYPAVFPEKQQLVIKAPQEDSDAIESVLENAEQFYKDDVTEIPTIHFDRHLYSPLAVWKKGNKFQRIKTVPVKLNEGETKFVNHLQTYLKTNAERFKDKEVYLLRNLAQKGVGFFIESSSFFPDFILWVVEKGMQHIFFLDPKGLQYEGNFQSDKIVFCNEQITQISESIQQKLKEEDKDFSVSIQAYILSVTEYEKIKESWGNRDATKQDFLDHNVLFIEEDMGYLEEVFGGVIG